MSSLSPTKKANIKPECVISSGYDPIKSEETDDEDNKDIDDTSNSHKNISIKQEAVKVELKEEDEVSTDDERYSPDHVISSSSGYDPVKSEETDDDELDDKDSTSNEQNRPIKEEYKEVKMEDEDSTDDEYSSRRV